MKSIVGSNQYLTLKAMAKYAKAHPFGYVGIKKAKADRNRHFGEQKKETQSIHMKNGQIRTIQHYY